MCLYVYFCVRGQIQGKKLRSMNGNDNDHREGTNDLPNNNLSDLQIRSYIL